MKTLQNHVLKRFGERLLLSVALISTPLALSAQTGRIQLIHGSADTTVAVVDLYIDGALQIDDFAYPGASPFMDIAAGSHQIVLAPASSASVADSIITFDLEVEQGEAYHAIVAGVFDPSLFHSNPDERDIGLDLFAQAGALEASTNAGHVAERQFYGVIDLPAVDFAADGQILRNTLRFGDFTGYEYPAPQEYVGTLKATGLATSSLYETVRSFSALADQAAITVFTGSFSSSSGLALTSFLVLPDGTIDMSENSTRFYRAQIVHASADPAVETIDLYMDGGLLMDNFAFKRATKFIDLPSGVHEFAIAPATSASKKDALKKYRLSYQANKSYSVVMAGVVDPDAFAPNPDGRDTELNLFVSESHEVSPVPGDFSIRTFFAGIDWPKMDFTASGTPLWYNMGFGDFSAYEDAKPQVSTGIWRASGLATSALMMSEQDFTQRGGLSLLGIETGFFSGPNGLGMTNFVVLPDGTIVDGVTVTTNYRAQIVHASADPAVETIDFYMDGGLLIDDFAFQGATKFLDLPSGVHEFAIAPAASTSKSDALETYRLSYQKDKSYSVVVAGVLDPASFPSNPDGRDTNLNLFVADEAPETSTASDRFSSRYFNAIPDIPIIEFWIEEWGETLFDQGEGYGFGDFSGLVDGRADGLLTGSLRPAGSTVSDPPIFSVEKDWREEYGHAILEIGAGFLNATGKTASDDIVWFFVREDGSIGTPEVVTSTENDRLELPSTFAVLGNYPNPFNPSTNVTFDLPHAADVVVDVFDITGRKIFETTAANLPAGTEQSIRIDASAWGSGLYLYRIVAHSGTSSWTGTGQMMLLK